jgi:Zn-dependent peptidase ImmA (M78 family)
MIYDELLKEAAQHGIYTYEKPLSCRTKGLYSDNVICINSNQLSVEKTCAMAEEIGHYHTTSGNILDQSTIQNRKQERRARIWSHRRLIPLSVFVQAHKAGVRNRFELAAQLDVTEDFLQTAIDKYREKYGLFVKLGRHTICFEPLGVMEFFE